MSFSTSTRIPASLLYLTIYNPTLRPAGQAHGNDEEDAEEQAHILFYTSRERAVSRDRMLRQVGLAKALVSFSGIFNVEQPCSSVHSQSRRMVMVNPEPGYWIHAAIELARSPRLPPKSAGAIKVKRKDKSKAKETQEASGKEQEVVYDYHDGAIHDCALRAHILRGYELFKITHGSFTSIMSSLGQQALELQLERFFTVWAWSWDFEGGKDLSLDLGLPLHPLYQSLRPLVDDFTSALPDEINSFIFSPPYIIPSTRFRESHLPLSLPSHLLSLINPLPTKKSDAGSRSDIPAKGRPPDLTSDGPDRSGATNAFLAVPSMNMNINLNANLDVRKWSWPGYLSFGKGGVGKKVSEGASGEWKKDDSKEGEREGEEGKHKVREGALLNVDRKALEDAISSENSHNYAEGQNTGAADSQARRDTAMLPSEFPAQPLIESSAENTDGSCFKSITVPLSIINSAQASVVQDGAAQDLFSLPNDKASFLIAPQFFSTYVHLADLADTLVTEKKQVLYSQVEQFTLVLVGGDVGEEGGFDPQILGEPIAALVHNLEKITEEHNANCGLDSPIPSATKILQPKDKYLIRQGTYTTSSVDFSPRSEHLYNAKALLDRNPELVEVFSRGQNPQHWYVSRKISGVENLPELEGEVFMEVARKEANLAEVDNALQKVHNMVERGKHT